MKMFPIKYTYEWDGNPSQYCRIAVDVETCEPQPWYLGVINHDGTRSYLYVEKYLNKAI